MALSKLPDFMRASLVSTKTEVSLNNSLSLSRMVGLKLPIRSTCVPACTQSHRINGSVERVAQLTMSFCFITIAFFFLQKNHVLSAINI